MTDEKTPAAPGGAIREEAATWFARMRGPEADADRPVFEAWLAESPVHRDAYSRIAEVFSLGKGLGADAARRPADPIGGVEARSAGVRLVATLCGIVFAGSLGIGGWSWLQQRAAPDNEVLVTHGSGLVSQLALATPVGAIRSWRLPDGSRVTLDTGSALQTGFTPALRTLRLLRGRARFDVAHEARPFVVTAGAGTVTAHGTLFDVRIQAGGSVSVRLLRGAIDVALPASGQTPVPLRERLAPGEQLVFDAGALPAPRVVAAPIDARWTAATLDCDRATLGAIVSEANRYSPTQIVLGDPALDGIAVSGTFRIDDPAKLAQRLGALFDLTVDRSVSGRLVLKRG